MDTTQSVGLDGSTEGTESSEPPEAPVSLKPFASGKPCKFPGSFLFLSKPTLVAQSAESSESEMF